MLAQINSLRRLAERLNAGELGTDGAWLGGALCRYLDQAREGMTLGVALEIDGPWWMADRRARRDAELREYVRRFLPAGSLRAKASALGTAVQRYEASGWLRDRRISALPPGTDETPRAFLFRACVANAADGDGNMPTGLRQLERILSDCSD